MQPYWSLAIGIGPSMPNFFVDRAGGNDNKLSFFLGSPVINVASNTLRIYVLLQKRPNS